MKNVSNRNISMNKVRLLLLGGVMLLIAGCREKSVVGPEQSLQNFQLEDGFNIELIAAEPLVTDPVDMEIDEFGRLYIVEMPGYPLDKSGSGKIILLSDSNSDGLMDKRQIFADNLVLPNSIMRWKGGIIVTDAPNVLYFEDSRWRWPCRNPRYIAHGFCTLQSAA